MVLPQSSEIEQQWSQVRGLLRAEVGDTAYSTWLKPLDLACVDGDRVVIAVPTQFMRDWVVAHYADRIRGLWTSINPNVRSIALNVRPAAAANSAQANPAAMPAAPAVIRPAEQAEAAPASDAAALEELGARLDPRFTFETFVVGKPNEFAVAAAERVASSPKPPFNPLFLYGGVGLGKTHLMHAIAHRVKQLDPNRRVVYLSAEKFMYQFVRALRSKDTMSFKELFRSVDLLMVDDVQFISGKDSTQEEFFHTFNTLVDRGRQIVISADRSPSDLSGLEERIRSRLGWGLVADIHPTTYELRLGILQAKAEQLRVEIPLRVLEFLASRITSNVRELEGALNRIVHQASLVQKPISIDMAQEVLKDLLRANDRRVTIEEIQKAVVEHYNIRMADMTSARRSRAVARPRQVAMYLAKQLTPRSLPEIGKKFGGRDHTTVMHAVRQIERLAAEDRSIADDLEALKRKLQG
ncbi:chromosomal replication initiator protein DnaA [Benzoatithermus flavus]|uniref:Chromosomal replication initiator protein DnaA n=1 Tax=Benzoatithermus flavus TaxID=3108223 RepID=A0ABU8XP01_9PROT